MEFYVLREIDFIDFFPSLTDSQDKRLDLDLDYRRMNWKLVFSPQLADASIRRQTSQAVNILVRFIHFTLN